jgi:hypothetical protein
VLERARESNRRAKAELAASVAWEGRIASDRPEDLAEAKVEREWRAERDSEMALEIRRRMKDFRICLLEEKVRRSDVGAFAYK